VPFFDRSGGGGPLVAVEAAEAGETVPVLRRHFRSGRGKFLIQ
jgi:hypothetical protein